MDDATTSGRGCADADNNSQNCQVKIYSSESKINFNTDLFLVINVNLVIYICTVRDILGISYNLVPRILRGKLAQYQANLPKRRTSLPSIRQTCLSFKQACPMSGKLAQVSNKLVQGKENLPMVQASLTRFNSSYPWLIC